MGENEEVKPTKAHSFAKSHGANRGRRSTTLADMLCPLPDEKSRQQLEEFRIEYEAEYGPTDLTRRYTSMWPEKQQIWLSENLPKEWFGGLPPFAKAFFLGKMQLAAQEGNLDAIPNGLLRLFIKGQLLLDEDAPQR